MRKGIIDRFEGGYAVIEFEGGFEKVEMKLLPKTAKEGDTVVMDGNSIFIDREESEERRHFIQQLAEKLFKSK